MKRLYFLTEAGRKYCRLPPGSGDHGMAGSTHQRLVSPVDEGPGASGKETSSAVVLASGPKVGKNGKQNDSINKHCNNHLEQIFQKPT